eukprot:TRINITY_DN67216_c5_g1_i3.p1 TRINITY_DN67216_c5_g1~~TRINITY_DN67216_c5_g1_i3.p1  ORF type:complete len:212 (-),score=26.39 TRINITY_DN67216_c5_g1_i3:191-826(-)
MHHTNVNSQLATLDQLDQLQDTAAEILNQLTTNLGELSLKEQTALVACEHKNRELKLQLDEHRHALTLCKQHEDLLQLGDKIKQFRVMKMLVRSTTTVSTLKRAALCLCCFPCVLGGAAKEALTVHARDSQQSPPKFPDNKLIEMIKEENNMKNSPELTRLKQWEFGGHSQQTNEEDMTTTWIEKVVLKKFGYLDDERTLFDYRHTKHGVG